MVLKLPYKKLVRLSSYQKGLFAKNAPTIILWGHFFALKKSLKLALTKKNKLKAKQPNNIIINYYLIKIFSKIIEKN